MPDRKVVILDCNFPDIDIERAVLAEIGVSPALFQCETEDDVIASAGNAEGVIVQYAPVTARALNALERCSVIVRYGIGVDNVDLTAATANRIWVCNVPGFCTPEVSDQVMALLLNWARRLPALDALVRSGGWLPMDIMRPTARISTQTLGLVGFGNIARAVARKAQAFGLEVIASAPRTTAATMAEFGTRKVPFETLVAESDYLVLLCPLTDETHNLIDANVLRSMKPRAFLVNVSRGGLVDEEALVAALEGGHIAGVALDVFAQEPVSADSPLLKMKNVMLSPHISYYSDDAQADLQRAAAGEVARVLSGQRPRNALNAELTPRYWHSAG